jgi:hypothetical protein
MYWFPRIKAAVALEHYKHQKEAGLAASDPEVHKVNDMLHSVRQMLGINNTVCGKRKRAESNL